MVEHTVNWSNSVKILSPNQFKSKIDSALNRTGKKLNLPKILTPSTVMYLININEIHLRIIASEHHLLQVCHLGRHHKEHRRPHSFLYCCQSRLPSENKHRKWHRCLGSQPSWEEHLAITHVVHQKERKISQRWNQDNISSMALTVQRAAENILCVVRAA